MSALKIEKATFVGHSMGSFISRIMAITYPESVDKLVLIGTSHTLVNTPLASELWNLISPVILRAGSGRNTKIPARSKVYYISGGGSQSSLSGAGKNRGLYQ